MIVLVRSRILQPAEEGSGVENSACVVKSFRKYDVKREEPNLTTTKSQTRIKSS